MQVAPSLVTPTFVAPPLRSPAAGGSSDASVSTVGTDSVDLSGSSSAADSVDLSGSTAESGSADASGPTIGAGAAHASDASASTTGADSADASAPTTGAGSADTSASTPAPGSTSESGSNAKSGPAAADTASTGKGRGPERGSTTHAGQAGRLTPAQLRLVAALQSRDREVRDHEAAHQAAGGNLVGGASYSYQQGPDGRSYAVGGEVSVDASPVQGDPRATIAKMQRVRAAALAPAQPSGQDLAVAAAAAQLEAGAEQELAQEQAKTSSAAGSTDRGQSGTSSSTGSGLALLGAAPARRDAITAYTRTASFAIAPASSIDFSA